jgi:hypothetical protein
MGNVIVLNRKRTFSVIDAGSILPLVYRVTEAAHLEIKRLIDSMDQLPGNLDEQAVALEGSVVNVIQKWQDKVQKLGALPLSLGSVEFDTGDGFFSWKYPETEIKFWRAYADSHLGRVLIEKPNGTV